MIIASCDTYKITNKYISEVLPNPDLIIHKRAFGVLSGMNLIKSRQDTWVNNRAYLLEFITRINITSLVCMGGSRDICMKHSIIGTEASIEKCEQRAPTTSAGLSSIVTILTCPLIIHPYSDEVIKRFNLNITESAYKRNSEIKALEILNSDDFGLPRLYKFVKYSPCSYSKAKLCPFALDRGVRIYTDLFDSPALKTRSCLKQITTDVFAPT